MKNILLSISLLTSNRMDTIPRCLESLKPILEAIPSELIIVDTSNNPEVYECDLKYTDQVVKFDWCNDFAKARNVGLQKAKGEWFLFIDDDEWFLDSAPIIEFFKSGDYKNYGYAFHQIRNYGDTEFKSYKDAWVMRLVKIYEDTQFYSKVHEYIEPLKGKRKNLDALTGHSGYIYQTEEERKAHFERNASLLKRMEKEEPDNLRWKLHMVQEYRAIKDWDALEIYGREIIENLHAKGGVCKVLELMQIYIGYLNALNVNNKHVEIKEFYEKYYKEAKDTIAAKAYLNFIMATSCYELKDYELVEKCASKYLKAYEMCQKNPAICEEEVVHIILMDAFVDKIYSSTQTLLLLSLLELKKYDKIEDAYKKINWQSEEQKLFYNVHIKLIEALLAINDDEMLKIFLKDSLSASHIKSDIINSIADWSDKNEKDFAKLNEFVKEINVWEWYKLYIALVAKHQASKEEIRKIGVSFLKQAPNVFQIPEMVHKTFGEQSVELEGLFAELDFMTWKTQLAEHFDCINMQQLDELKVRLENSSLNGDVRFAYFMMLYAEQKLLHTEEDNRSFEFYNEMLYLFSQYTCTTYETLYADEIPNMELEQLPKNYQAALWLKVYFEEVEKDIKTALPCLSRVMETYPLFQEVIKGYLERLKQEMMV